MGNPANGPRLGLDLGGSKILATLVEGDRVLASEKVRTRPELGYGAVVKRIKRVARSVCKAAGMSVKHLPSVGVGVPSPVLDNRLLHAPNLGWQNAPLATDLQAALKCGEVLLANDVNCGALGEAQLGAARDAQSVFALFVGTGLGGGWVLHGRVHEGVSGFAGEVGHIQLYGQHAPCACGQVGCLETVASKRGIQRLLKEAVAAGEPCALENLDDLRSKDIEQAYRSGCPSTVRAIHSMAQHLAWAMNTISAVINPEVFVLGGGIGARLGEDLLPLINQARAKATFVGANGPYEVRIAQLGTSAVAIGASALR